MPLRNERREKEIARRAREMVNQMTAEECVQQMHEIIQGEHRRSFRNHTFIEHMKEELKGE